MKERILNYIAKLKKESYSKAEFEPETLEAVKKVFNQYNSSDIESILNINVYDFFMAYLLLTCQSNFYDDLERIAKSIKPILDLDDANQIKVNINFLVDYLSTEKNITEKKVDDTLIEVIPKSFSFTKEILEITDLKDPYDDNFYGGMEAILATLRLCQFISDAEVLLNRVEEQKNSSKKVKRKTKYFLFKNLCNESELNKILENINEFVVFLNNKGKHAIKRINRRNKMLEEIEVALINNTLTDIKPEWHTIDDKGLLIKSLYHYVLSDVQNEYDNIQSLIQSADKETKEAKLEILLSEYGLHLKDFNDTITNKLMMLDLGLMKEKLDLLKEYSLPISEFKGVDLSIIISQSIPETISGIERLIKGDIIKLSFIKKHPEIFIGDDQSEIGGLYKVVNTNIESLKSLKIDFNKQDFNDDILLGDTEQIASNVSLLNEYNLNKMKQENKIGLINGNISFDTVDVILEENGDISTIGKMKFTKDEFNMFKKRVHIANELGMISNRPDIIGSSTIVNGNKFIVADSDLDDNITDAGKRYQNNEMKLLLDKSKRNKITDISKSNERILSLNNQFLDKTSTIYDFDGVKISKCKVLRNMEVLLDNGINSEEGLFNAIIYNTFLRRDQIIKIKQDVESFDMQKTR